MSASASEKEIKKQIFDELKKEVPDLNFFVANALCDLDERNVPWYEWKDGSGMLILHWVCSIFGSDNFIEMKYATCPYWVTGKDKNGWTPLHCAVRHGQPSGIIKLLAQKAPGDLKRQNNDSWTPLHVACRYNPSVDILRALMEEAPDATKEAVKIQTNKGMTPLHLACLLNAPLPVIQLLFTFWPGAIVEKQATGKTPLDLAMNPKQVVRVDNQDVLVDVELIPANIEWLGLVRRYYYSQPLLHRLLWVDRSIDDIDAAIGGLGVLMETDDRKNLPLHVACRMNAPLEVIQRVASLWPGAVNARNAQGKTPLDLAQEPKRLDERAEQVDATPVVENVEWLQKVRKGQSDLPDLKTDRDAIQRASAQGRSAFVSQAYVRYIKSEEVLGQGIFGSVFKGHDRKLNQKFAVKMISPEIRSLGDTSAVKQAMTAFHTEREALAHFSHPNITSLYAYSCPSETSRGDYYLLYELAENGDLRTFLEKNRLELSFTQRLNIAIDFVTAVVFLHAGNKDKGIARCCHRDIKSANIVLTDTKRAKLIDCGLAMLVMEETEIAARNHSVSSQNLSGSMGYMCPNYFNGSIVKFQPKCDIFSVGVVLIELLTGKLQNQLVTDSATFNFYNEYIIKKRKLMEDVDKCMELASPEMVKCASDFADLAVRCMSDTLDLRPNGKEVLAELRSIKEAYDSGDSGASQQHDRPTLCNRILSVKRTLSCALCRGEVNDPNHPFFSKHTLCSYCIESFETNIISQKLGSLEERLSSSLSKQSNMILEILQNQRETYPVIGQLSLHLMNSAPRRFILKGNTSKGVRKWMNPKHWFKQEFHLHFVCADSLKATSSPVVLSANQNWLKRVAPALVIGLRLVQVSIKAASSLDLSDVMDFCEQSLDDIMGHLITLASQEKAREIEDAIRFDLIDEDKILSLTGAAYMNIVSLAMEQADWLDEMVPVTKPPGQRVTWVMKEVAQDPSKGYEIVRPG